jgi:hypothetical protein
VGLASLTACLSAFDGKPIGEQTASLTGVSGLTKTDGYGRLAEQTTLPTDRTEMTTALPELTEMNTKTDQPIVALYNRDDRLTGIVNGWKVADGVMEMDESIKRAVATSELTMAELVEIDQSIARLRNLRGTL